MCASWRNLLNDDQGWIHSFLCRDSKVTALAVLTLGTVGFRDSIHRKRPWITEKENENYGFSILREFGFGLDEYIHIIPSSTKKENENYGSSIVRAFGFGLDQRVGGGREWKRANGRGTCAEAVHR